jgi:hypothetical protein
MKKEIQRVGGHNEITKQHSSKKQEGNPEDHPPGLSQFFFGEGWPDEIPELVKYIWKGNDQSADQHHRKPHAELAGYHGALEPEGDPFHTEGIAHVKKFADPADDPVGGEIAVGRAQQNAFDDEFIPDTRQHGTYGNGHDAAEQVPAQLFQVVNKRHFCLFFF